MNDVASVTEVMCGKVESSCVCALTQPHDGPHRCDCGGEWDYRDGRFVPVTFPGIFGAIFRGGA